MIYLWAFLASLVAASMEGYYRSSNNSWLETLPYMVVPAVLINYFIYKVLKASDSLVSAFILFGISNALLRTLTSVVILKEKVGRGTWVAIGLTFLAQVVKSIK